MMLFIGNDFIPRLPVFEIGEGALDYMFDLYKMHWEDIGYLSNNGQLIWPSIGKFIELLVYYEQGTLNKRTH
jgi:5'-3' exonuclease